jgi:hypothetical protein
MSDTTEPTKETLQQKAEQIHNEVDEISDSKEDIVASIDVLVSEFNVPLDEAVRSVKRKYIIKNEETEPVKRTKRRNVDGSKVKLTVEIDDGENLTNLERRQIADAVLEDGLNTEEVSWDRDHPVPTVDNEVV